MRQTLAVDSEREFRSLVARACWTTEAVRVGDETITIQFTAIRGCMRLIGLAACLLLV